MKAAAISLLLLAAGPICQAQGDKPKMDPKVQAVLDQMAAAYKGANAAHMKVTVKTTGAVLDVAHNIPLAWEIKLIRPNMLWLTSERVDGGNTTRRMIVCNGKSVWDWSSATNSYTLRPAPKELRLIKDLPDDLPPMDLLLFDKSPLFEMQQKGASLTLGRPENAGGVDLDPLETRFAAPDTPVSLALRVLVGQKDHLLHGIHASVSGKNPTDGKELAGGFDLVFDVADLAPTFTVADFKFTPPPGATRAGVAPPKPPAKSAAPGKTPPTGRPPKERK